jgi:hypothetical protein
VDPKASQSSLAPQSVQNSRHLGVWHEVARLGLTQTLTYMVVFESDLLGVTGFDSAFGGVFFGMPYLARNSSVLLAVTLPNCIG